MKPSIMCGTAANENCPRYQTSWFELTQKPAAPPEKLLQLIVGSPDHTLLLSPFLLQELERVFSYERVRLVSKLTDDEIAEFLSYLRAEGVSEVIFAGPAPRVVPFDPDDDPDCTHSRHGPSWRPLHLEPPFLQYICLGLL